MVGRSGENLGFNLVAWWRRNQLILVFLSFKILKVLIQALGLWWSKRLGWLLLILSRLLTIDRHAHPLLLDIKFLNAKHLLKILLTVLHHSNVQKLFHHILVTP